MRWFIIKRKKKPVPIDEKYLLAPHVWAFKELEKLEKEKVWQQNIKEYYSRLTDVARTYIELRYKVPAMEKTTEPPTCGNRCTMFDRLSFGFRAG